MISHCRSISQAIGKPGLCWKSACHSLAQVLCEESRRKTALVQAYLGALGFCYCFINFVLFLIIFVVCLFILRQDLSVDQAGLRLRDLLLFFASQVLGLKEYDDIPGFT